MLSLATLLVWLYLSDLDAVGLLGPDEPRYASIAREMARSGDWLAPRLWGQWWFEKPPLTYWLIAAGFQLGLSEDLAPRLPIALASLGFLAFYYRVLSREFGTRVATYSLAVLGCSVGWLAFSRVGVTDLPMAATFASAMFLLLPWLDRGERRGLTAAAAMLGLAVLAKGFVPVVLFAPVLAMGVKRLRDWLRPAPLAAFLLVAAPWYVAMSLRFGQQFWGEFFWKHHVARLHSSELQHVQPFWFYLPVLALGMFPWTPLLGLLARRQFYADARVRFLAGWVFFGLLFFSVVRNKLPGYLLPLMPALSALAGKALAEARLARWALAGCGLLVGLVPVGLAILPEALLLGIRRVHWQAALSPWMTAGLAVALWCGWWSERRRGWAVAAVAAGVGLGFLALRVATFPSLEERVSARGIWAQIKSQPDAVCVESLDRERRYGLNYYSVMPLPDCAAVPRSRRLRERPDHSLELAGP